MHVHATDTLRTAAREEPSRRSWKWRLCAAIGLCLWLVRGAHADYLVVAAQGTEHLLRFDLATGEASVLGNYERGAVPSNLAVDDSGTIYASVFGGNKNVVKFVPSPGGGPLVAEDFTPTIGGFGPGQIAFHDGSLYAAGDADDVIHQYDAQTGAEIRTFSASTSFNIRALTISGDHLYYAEIFQDRVNRFDLTQSPPTGGFFFQDGANLSEPMGLTIGHNGNLVFAGRDTTLIQEFDIHTGEFVGTIADLSSFASGFSGANDITYSPRLDNYFVSAGDTVFRFDEMGQLVRMYESPLMPHASGVLVVIPEPASGTIALLAGVATAAVLGFRRRSTQKCTWLGNNPRTGASLDIDTHLSHRHHAYADPLLEQHPPRGRGHGVFDRRHRRGRVEARSGGARAAPGRPRFGAVVRGRS